MAIGEGIGGIVNRTLQWHYIALHLSDCNITVVERVPNSHIHEINYAFM